MVRSMGMPFRLVAIGDSTVEGLEDPGPDGVYIGWADRFAGHLDVIHPGLLYANLAVRGQTAHEVRQTQLRLALEMAPDITLVVAGVNDILRPRFGRDGRSGHHLHDAGHGARRTARDRLAQATAVPELGHVRVS